MSSCVPNGWAESSAWGWRRSIRRWRIGVRNTTLRGRMGASKMSLPRSRRSANFRSGLRSTSRRQANPNQLNRRTANGLTFLSVQFWGIQPSRRRTKTGNVRCVAKASNGRGWQGKRGLPKPCLWGGTLSPNRHRTHKLMRKFRAQACPPQKRNNIRSGTSSRLGAWAPARVPPHDFPRSCGFNSCERCSH